ncbi:hypothetical protein MLD38_012204 [Melastoma candidum]|uniref:Uncharacterized protein n=1 Tax=Melastoma candidum TaxID=119954 RepID=A0ACB9R660_9MYRT|nr:hypothetical protein MLD38_012204 [Melastoma candidum]
MGTSFRSSTSSLFALASLSLIVSTVLAHVSIDPTKGFEILPFNKSYYHIQKPYDVPLDQRYSFVHGIHKCWVYATDKPHTPTSKTKPRTEIAIGGYGYSSGVWQFEAYGYVPEGTYGVNIMQIFGGDPPHATTFMLRVYNSSLFYYSRQALVADIYNRWFRLNVVHDVEASKVWVYIDGALQMEADALGEVDPTEGFENLPFNTSFYHIQKPYDVPVEKRYSFEGGIHDCWVYADDKPHTPNSRTLPRTEVAIQGYSYSSGVWQLEGYGYVPSGTSGVCIMQVFGATHPRATTFMLRDYNGSLSYYRSPVLVYDIYDKWFRLNVIHDVDASKVRVYIDGELKIEANDGGGTFHAFKFGVYAQKDGSSLMESRWKDIKIWRK